MPCPSNLQVISQQTAQQPSNHQVLGLLLLVRTHHHTPEVQQISQRTCTEKAAAVSCFARLRLNVYGAAYLVKAKQPRVTYFFLKVSVQKAVTHFGSRSCPLETLLHMRLYPGLSTSDRQRAEVCNEAGHVTK